MHFCIWFLSLLSLNQVEAQKGLEFPVHDGRERLINLKKKNFDRFVKKYDILVVYFYAPPKDEGEERNWELTKQMLELAAQITEREGIAFGVVDLSRKINSSQSLTTNFKLMTKNCPPSWASLKLVPFIVTTKTNKSSIMASGRLMF